MEIKVNQLIQIITFRSSYGYGIKFYTIIGPIGFSWAFPLSDESYDIKRMFLFSVGNLN